MGPSVVLTAFDLLTKMTLLWSILEVDEVDDDEEEVEEEEEELAMVTPVGGTVSMSVTGATRLLKSWP